MRFLFTTLVNLIGIAVLVIIIVVPILPQFRNDSRVDSLLGTILCNPGERLVREPSSNVILSRINLTVAPACISQQGQRRDVTTRWITIGLGGFVVAFIAGFVLEIVLIVNSIRRGIARSFRRRNNPPSQPVTTPPPPPVAVSLTEQLQQLEEAKKAGLITYDEYDRLRQDILRKQL